MTTVWERLARRTMAACRRQASAENTPRSWGAHGWREFAANVAATAANATAGDRQQAHAFYGDRRRQAVYLANVTGVTLERVIAVMAKASVRQTTANELVNTARTLLGETAVSAGAARTYTRGLDDAFELGARCWTDRQGTLHGRPTAPKTALHAVCIASGAPVVAVPDRHLLAIGTGRSGAMLHVAQCSERQAERITATTTGYGVTNALAGVPWLAAWCAVWPSTLAGEYAYIAQRARQHGSTAGDKLAADCVANA